jgi:hypothetical protein
MCNCCNQPCKGTPCDFGCGPLSNYVQPGGDEPLTWNFSITGQPDPDQYFIARSDCGDIEAINAGGPCYYPNPCDFDPLYSALVAAFCPYAIPPISGTLIGGGTGGSTCFNGLTGGCDQTFTYPFEYMCDSGSGINTAEIYVRIVFNYTAQCGCYNAAEGSFDDTITDPTVCAETEGGVLAIQHGIDIQFLVRINCNPFDYPIPLFANTAVSGDVITESWCNEIDFGFMTLQLQAAP